VFSFILLAVLQAQAKVKPLALALPLLAHRST
jgi:hypothetical protein